MSLFAWTRYEYTISKQLTLLSEWRTNKFHCRLSFTFSLIPEQGSLELCPPTQVWLGCSILCVQSSMFCGLPGRHDPALVLLVLWAVSGQREDDPPQPSQVRGGHVTWAAIVFVLWTVLCAVFCYIVLCYACDVFSSVLCCVFCHQKRSLSDTQAVSCDYEMSK